MTPVDGLRWVGAAASPCSLVAGYLAAVLPRLAAARAWWASGLLIAGCGVALALTSAGWLLVADDGRAVRPRRLLAGADAPCRHRIIDASEPRPSPSHGRPRDPPATAAAPAAKGLPATLGRYRIESEIGRGAMGVVLPRARSADRPPGGHQDDGAEPRVRGRRAGRGARALLPRGRDGRAAAAPGHRHHLRRRRGRRTWPTSRWSSSRARTCSATPQPGRLLPVPQVLRDRRARGRGAGLRAPPGRGAPRHQAGQRHGRPGQRHA